MSKLLSLLKATMSGGIELFNYHGKTERSRRIMPLVLAILIGTVMLLSANAMTADFKEDGIATSTILSLYTFITTIIILTEGIYKSGDLLFRPRDNDALLAMPIKKSTIVFARIIKFYTFEMLYCLIFLLPAIVAFGLNTEVGAPYYLVAITMLLLVPIIPIALSCVAGLIISAISARFKHRVFFQIILSFAFLAIVAISILALNFTTNFGGQSIAMLGDNIAKFYYPASAFANLATHFDIGQYLAFVAINLAVLTVTVFWISQFYFRIVNRLAITKQSHGTNAKYNFVKHSQTFAIVKKELNRYFSTPVLLVNTALGLVLFVVAAIALCFNFDGIAASLVGSIEDFPLTIDELRAFLPGITFAIVAFASLMTFITATMISLEGKMFNSLKTMPVSGKKVIMSKVLAAMLLIVPITALGSIIVAIRFQFSFIDIILVLIGTIVLALVTELIGILINLKYPRFDAESDAVVVKQSASIMVATFVGLGMVLVTISLTFAAVFFAGETAGLAMMDAAFAIISLYLYFTISTRGEEKYNKLSA